MKRARKPYTRTPTRKTTRKARKATLRATTTGKVAKQARQKQERRTAPKARSAVYKALETTYATHDLEEALTRNLVTDNAATMQGAIPLRDIIYSLTPSMKNSAYRMGYSLGKNIHTMSPEKNVLPDVMERAGFGKVIYYPFEDRVVITSAHSKRGESTIKDNIHVCDAGIIAGYLSAATGQQIEAKETHCSYNGDEFCQFIATPQTHVSEYEGRRHDINSIVDAISHSMDDGPTGMSESYYALSAVPLMKEPMLHESSKLLYVAGKKLAESADPVRGVQTIVNMAKRLGIKDAHVKTGKDGNPTSISLEYGQKTSNKPFVELSTSLLAGFTNSLYNTRSDIARRLGRKSNYVVNLTLRN